MKLMKRILPWLGIAVFLVAQASGALAQSTIHVPADATLQNAIYAIDNGGTIEISGGTYAAPVNAFRVRPIMALVQSLPEAIWKGRRF